MIEQTGKSDITGSTVRRPRKLASLLAGGGAVMSFHGIGTGPPGSTMHVPADRFLASVLTLRRVANVVPLPELVSRHLAGRPTRGLVAITFDDGYASVLS